MARTVIIAGTGPGLGASLAHRFAEEGFSIGLFARSAEFIDGLAADLTATTPGEALAVQTDITDPDQVSDGFETVREEFGSVDVLVNNASAAPWAGVDIDPEAFEHSLRVGAMGSLHCTQEAVEDMRAGDGGTVIFSGATSAVRGRNGAVGFSAAKFASRGMAESLARELGPEGIHVAHVVIDGQIAPPDAETASRPSEEFLDPDAIADAYWHLVEQDRSAWTLELDLRPHVEEF
jgi:NAD(P)-dependent dehydrogenase (short-subunit alcohol dehydrogenase family)